MGNDLLTIKAADLDGLKEGLAAEPWVQEVQRYDDHLLVSARLGEEKIPVAVEIARRIGTVIQAISMRKPTLEDVFLHYTGKTIREEEDADAEVPRGRLRKRRGPH